MSSTRIKLAIDNWENYVAQMATMPDKELEKKLDLIHLQSEIAIQKKNEESIELLEIWRAQIIEARILKAENNIPDAPNEIELAIADIETTLAKAEERNEIIDELSQPLKSHKPKIQEDNSSQMSLF
ncbi:MAG TPA: hypothetical protein PLC65_16250 [Bacteroidia bacterium]|nr:hypothetical protein [Bacteroidia bacterium]